MIHSGVHDCSAGPTTTAVDSEHVTLQIVQEGLQVVFEDTAETPNSRWEQGHIRFRHRTVTIRIWDAHELEGTLLYNPLAHAILQPSPFVFTGHKNGVFSIAISPCGTLLASASKDTTVRLWNISTGTELSHLVRRHRLPVRCVTFSHDGQRSVTGSYDAMVRVWESRACQWGAWARRDFTRGPSPI